MSRESITWLNANTLIGFTSRRGTAWHWRAEEHGDTSNHYLDAVPLQDVQGRLFAWTADSRRLAVETPCSPQVMTHLDELGRPAQWAVVEGRQAICRSDDTTGAVMGIFGPGYARHQYREWLLSTVADLLDDDLAISSAGLLRGGAVAWVEVSMPETITTPEGVAFRPNLLATTSFDGSIATTYKRTITDTVCDNTRDLALAEPGPTVKIRHSRHSRAQLAPARQALQMIHTLAEDFTREVQLLCATPVSNQDWQAFLDAHIPQVTPTGQPLTGRALTTSDRKRETLQRLWTSDPRVSPWTGTAHGVLQAVNTYEHHEGVVRGTGRAERNSLKTLTDGYRDLDRTTLQTLTRVLQQAT